MRYQFLPQQGNELAVAKRIFIRNAEHHERFTDELTRKLLAQPVGVAALHYKNDFGPTQVPGRDAHPGPRLGPGRAGLVVRVAVEEPLGGGAAPLVLAANEEDSQLGE